MDDKLPVVRIWGHVRESDWNEYWEMDRVLRRSEELAAALGEIGASEVIEIRAALHDRVSSPQNALEVFVPAALDVAGVCSTIQEVTGLRVTVSPAETADEFHARASSHQLYARQTFELWEEKLPCFILGVDFDRGMDRWRKPAHPELWRLADHQADGAACAPRTIPALMLEPTEAGKLLLDELDREFANWFPGHGCNSRPPLDEIPRYRAVLRKYGVDCNESFRDGLVEGWYPIDIGNDYQDMSYPRTLCSTSLPDNLGESIVDAAGQPVAHSYSVGFRFVALTDN